MRVLLLATVMPLALASIATSAKADLLSPPTFGGSVAVGGTIAVSPSKVGTITAGTPTSAKADVLFVTDTTGSMGPAIGQIASAFSQVVSSISSLGDVATGAAEYKDAASGGDPFDYRLDQAITKNSGATQTALSALSAGGGGDDPEQGLYALTQAAGSTSGFRAGSKKIVVITGDAPSHDLAHPTAAGGVTVASAAAALSGAGVTVEALNASNITGDTGLDSFGQFDSTTGIFSDGVSGSYTSAFPDPAALASTLAGLIGSAFATYSDVSLALDSPITGGCTVALPSDITGSFNRSITRTFNFGAVDITGTHAGTCSFTIALEADGAVLATESDSVSVTGGGTSVPEPFSLGLFGSALVGLCAVRARRA